MSCLQQNWRKGRTGRRVGGRRVREGARGDPNNVSTYEYINNEKKTAKKKLVVPCPALSSYFKTMCSK
jgi:hypothetical protein